MTRAATSRLHPRAHAICDRCGFRYNHDELSWQHQWIGPQLQNLRLLVCKSCLDVPQEQLRTIILPPDPVPIENPRPEQYISDNNPISGLGTNFGNMIQNGGLSAAFDGAIGKPFGLSAAILSATASFTNYVGKQWNAVPTGPPTSLMTTVSQQQVTVTRFILYAPDDAMFWTLGPVDYALQGSDDGASWTTLYNNTGAGTVGEVIDIQNLTSVPYSYHRINFSGTGGGSIALAQFAIYGTGLSGSGPT